MHFSGFVIVMPQNVHAARNMVTTNYSISPELSDVTRNLTLGGLKHNHTNSFTPLPSSLCPPLRSLRSRTP